MKPLEEVDAALTGPGGAFEIETAEVGGAQLQVFKHRARNLRDILGASIERGDDELFIFDDGRRLTFAGHAQVVASVAAGLRDEYGIGKGDRVAILGANSAEWIVAAWATISLGAIAVGMNGWWTGDEIRYGLDLSDPKLLVADKRRLARVADDPPRLPTVVIEEGFEKLWNYSPDTPLPDTPVDEDDPAVILFTSGTTGRPKGAVSTHRNLIAFLEMIEYSTVRLLVAHGMPLDTPRPKMVAITSSPLFHVSGLQSAALSGPHTGNKHVWTTGRFDPEKVIRLTFEEGVTRWGGITTQLWRLLEHPEFEKHDFSQVRSIGGGGSTFSPELQRLIREKLPSAVDNFNVGYGMTECGGLATMATGDLLLEHPDCVGRALPTVEVAILDDDDQPQPDGVDGNICIRGAMVMPGYWRNPEANQDALRPGGWLKTGDIGQLRDGLLFLASRKRDMIIRGGENIYPVEIENRLEEHPDIREAAVIGVDHRTLGQEVKAVVVLQEGHELEPDAVREWGAETLAYYKVPTHVECRDTLLPRNATGKVLKQVLTGESESIFVEE